MKICGFDFKNTPAVMGILNVTPDSFSDGGRFFAVHETAKPHNSAQVLDAQENAPNTTAVLKAAEEMAAAGADILDLGAESTRPGFIPLSAKEELSRLLPALSVIKDSRLSLPVSIDTYKAETAHAALENGADIINAVFPSFEICEVAAKNNAPIILMHHKDLTASKDFESDLLDGLKALVDMAKKAGVQDKNIILDCGVGFGKTTQQNLKIIKGIAGIKALGFPVLLGMSKKSVIGNVLGTPTAERLSATIAASTAAVFFESCDILRVHDVKENLEAIKFAQAIKNA